MTIGVPRILVMGLAVLFSGYHVVLAVYSLGSGYFTDVRPVIVAMIVYAVATIAVLAPPGSKPVPVWIASVAVGMSAIVPPLVAAVLDPNRPGGTGYATWFVAAIGTLMTVLSVRRRPGFAWLGTTALVIETVLWAGLGALVTLGLFGSIAWVAVSHIIMNTLGKASRDSQRFAIAEREAADWSAAQEAHLYERQLRLGQTSAMALPMLRVIQRSHGDLTPAQRVESLHLESAIRDEIRGRKLLDDAVREQVMLARRRGTAVTLLDEGGLDRLDEAELSAIHTRLADALRDVGADKVIVRTVPEGSDTAVTVVGLRTIDDGTSTALGRESNDDDEVTLWLEIPRPTATAGISIDRANAAEKERGRN